MPSHIVDTEQCKKFATLSHCVVDAPPEQAPAPPAGPVTSTMPVLIDEEQLARDNADLVAHVLLSPQMFRLRLRQRRPKETSAAPLNEQAAEEPPADDPAREEIDAC